MLHGYIHARKLVFNTAHVDQVNANKISRLHIEHQAHNARKKAAANLANLQSKETPNMLPSPSTSTSSSSNSTPLGGHGTPVQSAPTENPALSNPNMLPPDNITTPVNSKFIWTNKAQSVGLRAASARLAKAEQHLNLPLLARHFPRTFMRMMNTSLTAANECEPDFQDDECELFWPGQAMTGTGLGWVCLIGMSMVKEFGREYGYQGVQGAVLRMAGDENRGHADPQFIPHSH